MGIAERKARERAERREAIIDAAEKVILESGFDGATMDEIAQKAELSKGALYLSFENKNEIYLAICMRGSQKLNERFAGILSMEKKGLEMIRLIGEAYLEFVTTQPLYFQSIRLYEDFRNSELSAGSPYAEECEECSREALGYMTRALEIGMQDGSINSSYDAKELSVLILACSKGIVQLAHLETRDPNCRVLDDMDLKIESLFSAFIGIIGEGIASKSNGTDS